MTEHEGKKLIRIQGFGKSSYGISSAISFAFVSKPVDGVRKQVSNFFSCRDHVNDTLRACVHAKRNDGKYSSEVDLTKLRLLIGKNCKGRKTRYAFKEKLFSAKRLVNFYEKIAGWDDPSKITTVRLKDSAVKNAWLLTGPVEWLRSSHLTSMVTLLFRVISNYGPIEFTDISSVEEWFEEIMEKQKEDNASGVARMDWDLGTYLPHTYQKFYMLMKYYDEIFVDPMEASYPEEGSVHETGGIYRLCTCNSGVPALDSRMNKAWIKYKEERQERVRLDEKERQERIRTKMEKQYEAAKGAPSL